MARTPSINSRGNVEWTEKVSSPDGDNLVVSLKLDAIDSGSGFAPQSKNSSEVGWLNFNTFSTINPDGSRDVDITVEADPGGVVVGNSYRFELQADDGVSTSSQMVILSVKTTNNLSKIDGKKIFWVDSYSSSNSNGEVFSGNLSTAWNLSTLSKNGTQFELAVGALDSIFVKPDGKKCYMSISDNEEIREYDVSTAWDLSTMTYAQTNSSLGIDGVSPIFFHPDGDRLYVGPRDDFKNNFTGTKGALVEFGLPKPWDISTASVNYSVDISANQERPRSIFFRSNGENMYAVSGISDQVSQYSLSTAWDFRTATHEKNSLGGKNYDAIWFKTDGEKVFLGVDNNSEVTGYNLSIKWDVGNATLADNRSVPGPKGLAFGVT